MPRSPIVVLVSLLLAYPIAMTAHAAKRSVEVIEAAAEMVTIPLNGGRLLRLPGPAETVFVANPEVVDIHVKSPALVYLTAKGIGNTTVFAVDSRERVIANIDVHVAADISSLQKTIDALHPGYGIKAHAVGASVVLTGKIPSASISEDVRALAEKTTGSPESVVNRLEIVEPMQVNLRVRIAEISREIQKQLGFNWSISDTFRGATWGLEMTNPFPNLFTDFTTQALSIGGNARGISLNAMIDILEEEKLVKILAEPNLSAMSGETASFLAGGEFPILVPKSLDQVTIEFKQFGVSLSFTPTIIGEDRINLHVRPEVSEISSTNSVVILNFQVPGITTRRAETTVELGSGQSFAIAGLLNSSTKQNVSRYPGLAELPILGPLFRSDHFKNEESELVIIVTPYIVQPVATAMAMPTDGFRPPSDADRFLRSQVQKSAPKPVVGETVQAGGRPLLGPIGFQLN